MLAGRYELGERIGRGGFGEVRVALDHATGERVAVKLLEDVTRESAARFAREARLIRQLVHPNTVRMRDFGQTDTGPFMVLELLRGETLSARLKRGSVAPALVTHVMHGLLGSLAEAHALGIVHRDVKPANIFLCDAQAGQLPHIKVLDFGIAKDPKSAGATVEMAALRAALAGGTAPMVRGHLTHADVMLGTPRYMAPEQITGAPIGPASDVYAAALIFAELLSGRPVFAGLSEWSMLVAKGEGARVPLSAVVARSSFGGVIDTATQFDPARRFANAGEMLRALSVVTPAGDTRERVWKWAAAAAVCVLFGAVAFAVWARSQSSDAPDASARSVDVEAEKAADPRSAPSAVASSSARFGERTILGPRTVLYSGSVEFDRRDLGAKLRRAGFEIKDIKEDQVQVTRAGGYCAAFDFPMPGSRRECARVASHQTEPPDHVVSTWMVLCHADGIYMLKCVQRAPGQPHLFGEFARLYGLDPDVVLSPK